MKRLAIALILLCIWSNPSAAQSPLDSARIARWRSDIRAMALDLEEATGVPAERARLIAYHAVSEAHRYGVPPALVFGVLMQETGRLSTRAVSVAGAQGIMQIMPNIWRPALGRYFGYDLFDEATNVRYGVWILAHYLHRSDGDWERALERYSGGARRYAELVRRHIERKAPRLCPGHSFHNCVLVPTRRHFGS